jgi:hexokinase
LALFLIPNIFSPTQYYFLAIDLSGKNLRILLLTLFGGEKEPDVSVNNYIVSNAIMKGTGEQVIFI